MRKKSLNWRKSRTSNCDLTRFRRFDKIYQIWRDLMRFDEPWQELTRFDEIWRDFLKSFIYLWDGPSWLTQHYRTLRTCRTGRPALPTSELAQLHGEPIRNDIIFKMQFTKIHNMIELANQNDTLTFGMLTRDQNNSRCSLSLAGLYFEYRIANSVNIPIWARSRPREASSKLISSSKYPRSW